MIWRLSDGAGQHALDRLQSQRATGWGTVEDLSFGAALLNPPGVDLCASRSFLSRFLRVIWILSRH